MRFSRLGRKADDEMRPPIAALRNARENVRDFRRARSAALPASFLDLLRGGVRDPPVGDRRRRDENIGRQRRLDRGKHFRRGFDMLRLDAGRIGQTRPGR